jgi:hypothetical protein
LRCRYNEYEKELFARFAEARDKSSSKLASKEKGRKEF